MPTTPKYLLGILDSITAEEPPEPALESLHARQAKKVRKVFEDPNIIGVGVSKKVAGTKQTDSLCVCFYVAKKLPPSQVTGDRFVPPVIATEKGRSAYTDVKEVGKIVPQDKALVKHAPIESGFSVGHIKTTAGTLGAIVKKGSQRYLLSNSHVLANFGRGKVGDKIVYPGPYDGGKLPVGWIAILTEAVSFTTGGSLVNEVDAAIAEIRDEHMRDLSFNLPGTTKPLGTVAPKRDMVVMKRGRTTGTTRGKIIDVDFRVVLTYPGTGEIGFTRQVLCTRYTDEGDSGSLVIDVASKKIVGLHFAGAHGGSVFNPIRAVMKALGFAFVAT